MTAKLTIWTVYARPSDYPDGYVARQYSIEPGRAIPLSPAAYAPSLEAVRAKIPPGLVRLDRNEGDDPCIVECWI